MNEKERLRELLQSQRTKLNSTDSDSRTSVIDDEFIGLVEKAKKAGGDFDYVGSMLLESKERLEQAEKELLNARGVYYARLSDLETILRD